MDKPIKLVHYFYSKYPYPEKQNNALDEIVKQTKFSIRGYIPGMIARSQHYYY